MSVSHYNPPTNQRLKEFSWSQRAAADEQDLTVAQLHEQAKLERRQRLREKRQRLWKAISSLGQLG